MAWEKDFVLCEGSGHAGVGSVFDLSNAQVAKTLGCKVIIVTQGGIGKPIDEVCLNQALFEKEGVEIIGVILNKVHEEKIPEITRFVRGGLKRKGLELLGVLPHEQLLAHPTMDLIRDELRAEMLNRPPSLDALVEDVVVGAMGAQNAIQFFQRGTLLITPGDREDILLAAGAMTSPQGDEAMAGIVLTGGLRPGENVLQALQSLPVPVLLVKADSYQVASRVHNLTVKTRPTDARKIALIRDLGGPARQREKDPRGAVAGSKSSSSSSSSASSKTGEFEDEEEKICAGRWTQIKAKCRPPPVAADVRSRIVWTRIPVRLPTSAATTSTLRPSVVELMSVSRAWPASWRDRSPAPASRRKSD